MKVVIIGGVAGGAGCAARLRRNDENMEIIMLEKGPYISYANCGLPYYLSGVIQDKDDLLLQTPETFRQRFNVDVRVNQEAVSIDRVKKTVTVKKQDGTTYDESYDKLVLSPGGKPLIPEFPGNSLPGIFTLKTVSDAVQIKEYIASQKLQTAVVLGGGYIGIEAAENLTEAGLEVTLIELSSQIAGVFDREIAGYIMQELREHKVCVLTEESVICAEKMEKGLQLQLKSGKTVCCGILIMGAGVIPDSSLAINCGLKAGVRNSISVNSKMQTSDPDIFAAGDAVETEFFPYGEKTCIPLAGPANRQARIIADVICNKKAEYRGGSGTSVLKCFSLTAACLGYSEKKLVSQKIPFIKSYSHSLSHAGYYPGGEFISIKLLFSPIDGKILGAQLAGREGTDKRADVLATAYRLGASVYDLTELELAYAPPYSSAKDPVNMAGYIAENILSGDVKVIYPEQVEALQQKNVLFLDVRDQEELSEGIISSSLHIPLNRLRDELEKIPKNREIAVYCRSGLRSYIACRMLLQCGFHVFGNLSGGFLTFKSWKYCQ